MNCFEKKHTLEAEAKKRRISLEERKTAIQEKELESANSAAKFDLEKQKLNLTQAELQAKVEREKVERKSQKRRNDMLMKLVSQASDKRSKGNCILVAFLAAVNLVLLDLA